MMNRSSGNFAEISTESLLTRLLELCRKILLSRVCFRARKRTSRSYVNPKREHPRNDLRYERNHDSSDRARIVMMASRTSCSRSCMTLCELPVART
jgi:hypothetical protein